MVRAVDQGLVAFRNRDALLFVVGPGNGPDVQHSSHDHGGMIDNAARHVGRRFCGPIQRNHECNIAARDHSDDR